MIVVADASPLRYLVLIAQLEIIPALYDRVLIPPAMLNELTQPRTPDAIRRRTTVPPGWLQLRAPSSPTSEFPSTLGPGEREAIALAEEVRADLLLVDDWAGRHEAERRNLTIQGTLGPLSLAAPHGLTDLPDAIERLRQTNFRARAGLIQSVLADDAKRKKN